MQVLDEQGRLFGVVNVVDAVAVLLALAVVAAGAAVVLGGDRPEDGEKRTVSVDFGPQSPQVATLVERGPADVAGANATITDVFRTPAPNDQVLVVARLRLDGQATEEGFLLGGTPVRYGRTLVVETPDYRLEGRVDALDVADRFDTTTTAVTVEANVSRAIAGSVSAGDSYRIGDRTVTRVTDVTVESGNEERRTVVVDLSLETRRYDGGVRYGGRQLRLGSRLWVRTDRYEFAGEITGIGDG